VEQKEVGESIKLSNVRKQT